MNTTDVNSMWFISGLSISLALLTMLFVMLTRYEYRVIRTGTHPIIRQMISKAIILAYKSSDQVTDEIGKRLHGLDKKAIAIYVYNRVLPDTIQLEFLPFQIHWKDFISEKYFSFLVDKELNQAIIGFDFVRHTMLEKMEQDIKQLDIT